MAFIGLSIVVLLVIAIVMLTVRGVFARDLTQAIRRVTQQEQDLQMKAEVLERRLAQMEHDHAVRLKQAEAEGQRLLQDARQQASNIRSAAIEEAKQHARQLMAETEQARQQMRRSLIQELNGRAIDSACQALTALLPDGELENLHEQLLARLITELDRVDAGPVAPGAAMAAQVRTARALSERQLEEIRQRLVRRMGTAVTCRQDADAALVAGAQVRVGDVIIEGDLRHYLERLTRRGEMERP